MQIGKYTLNFDSLSNYFSKVIFGNNSKSYWNNRFKRNWVTSNGRLQTAIFTASFCMNDIGITPKTIIDFGCGAGDSVPFLKLKYPNAEIYLFDFSEKAQELQKKYQKYSVILKDVNDSKRYDLVYCSNVIEHILELTPFLEKLCSLSNENVVIQAPYSEFHKDGNLITPDFPKGEHVRTITESFIQTLPTTFEWKYYLVDAPVAWDYGKQVIYWGKKTN
jgi:cyclopropane fatty-acyl-phospholipid synthase-like methyltransferase